MAAVAPPAAGLPLRRALLACLLLAAPALARAEEWLVGRGHRPWAEFQERWLALDDSTAPGAIQPRQIQPGENVLRTGPPNPGAKGIANAFGYAWSFKRGDLYMALESLETGWNPRLWAGGGTAAAGNPALIDGVEDLSALFTEAPITGRPNADEWHTLDLAIPVPIDSVAFFPPQRGLHPVLGQLYKDLAPRGYAVSRTRTAVNWLIDDEEPSDTGRRSSYHPLPEVVAQTFGNPRSVVGLSFPLRFTRFLRFYFGGVAQTFSIAELQAFGRGFPAEARYVSRPVAVGDGRPLSFGRIRWHLSRFTLGPDGTLAADSLAPVRLELRTRTGLDDEPRVYHVFDELGKQQVVDRAAFLAAPLPRSAFQLGSAGSRGAVTEDTGNWDPWSSPYQQSGEEMRSSDARPYLQFRFQLETDDPMAFARLDSLAIEYSPLLAANVFGEVSVEGQGADEGPARIESGTDTVLVYDLRAVFDSADQEGFDGLELDVPPGTRYLGLEMGPAAVAPDSVIQGAADRLWIWFPSHRITRDSNPPLRIRLRGTVFEASTYITGQVFDSRGTRLSQTITPGDANPNVGANSIQVRSSEVQLRVLEGVDLRPAAISPNDDGANDELRIGFGLFGVERAGVEIGVLDLAGHGIAQLRPGVRAAGRHAAIWDGRDDAGNRVPPGVYLIRIEVEVDQGVYRALRPVAVVY